MKIKIIAVGQKMPKWVQLAWDDYAKRFPAELNVELIEVKPEPRTTGKTVPQMMAAESKRIQAHLNERDRCYALDERGIDFTTVKLSQQLQQWQQTGQDIALIIGGPDGLDTQFKQQTQGLIRLSSLTLPHPMVRIVLLEQLYRAHTIIINHPYHRA